MNTIFEEFRAVLEAVRKDDKRALENLSGGSQKPQPPENANPLGGGQEVGPASITGGITPTGSPMYTGVQAVASLSGLLNHPCQINHDAGQVGAHHASILVHPEWNQSTVKDRADTHLTGAGFSRARGDGYRGTTYTHKTTGAKVHVAHVGKHLLITSEDKKGTPAHPIPPREPQTKDSQASAKKPK